MPALRADVVVIGGGIVGGCTSAFLVEAGARVILAEQEAIGAAASGRNSGVIQHPFDPILAGLYRESLELYRKLADGADEFDLPAEAAGLLLVSTDTDRMRHLAAELAAAMPDFEPALFEGPDLQRLEPALAWDVAACRLAIGYPVRPGAAARAYAQLAQRGGARVVVGHRAELVVDGDRVTGVRLAGRDPTAERIDADSVVVAGGPWTPLLLDPSGSWAPITSSWGVVAELELAGAPRHVLEEAEIDAAIEPPAESAEVDLSGIGFSLVTAAGRSALGSTFLDERPEPASYLPVLIERGTRFVPGVASARVTGSRVCARPVSRDGRPLVGRVPWLRNAFVAAGHGPWGISTGPASGRLVADLMLGRRPAIPSALDPARFGSP